MEETPSPQTKTWELPEMELPKRLTTAEVLDPSFPDRRADFIRAKAFREIVDPLWQAAEDKCALPSPLHLDARVGEARRRRQAAVGVLTRRLAAVFADEPAPPVYLVVSPDMKPGDFHEARNKALERAGVEKTPPPPKWIDFLFLYMQKLQATTTADLARDFLCTLEERAAWRKEKATRVWRSRRNSLEQGVRDAVARADKFLQKTAADAAFADRIAGIAASTGKRWLAGQPRHLPLLMERAASRDREKNPTRSAWVEHNTADLCQLWEITREWIKHRDSGNELVTARDSTPGQPLSAPEMLALASSLRDIAHVLQEVAREAETVGALPEPRNSESKKS